MSFLFGEKYDTIIVGGGITGLFLAYKLKDTKQNILLIEKEKELPEDKGQAVAVLVPVGIKDKNLVPVIAASVILKVGKCRFKCVSPNEVLKISTGLNT